MQSANYGAPNDILRQGASEEKGERAKLANLMGAVSVAEVVKSTLGPKGMDKILQSIDRNGSVRVTNDGATILNAIHIDNPAAKLLIDISKAQDEEAGDGTTSVTVLAGELLRRAERLLLEHSIHPQTIIDGFRAANELATQTLAESSQDNSHDQAAYEQDLMNLARTTLSSKVVSLEKDHFAKLCVDAVLRLKGSMNLDMITILKRIGGTMRESYLEPGFLLDKRIGMGQPRELLNAKVMLANTSMDADKIKLFGAKVKVDSVAKLAEIEVAEKSRMHAKVDKICAHGIDCFINRQLIYNYPEELFAQKGVMAIEHADFEGVERLARALGADVLSTFDDSQEVRYGTVGRIDEVMIGEDTVIRFSGLQAGEACTIVLRGTSQHIVDEAERSIHDALCVISQFVNNSRTVLGAGCSEMRMATVVEEAARLTVGKKALAMEAFASALRSIPAILAENAGLDSTQLVSGLRAAHTREKNCPMGIDIMNGELADVRSLGVMESHHVKRSVVNLATEAAEMILRVDTILRAVPRKQQH
ncbi:chaperonin containing t-complex protein [Perkinsela sp. CCAP 1560/4]|nr:chaperonin containing t-complex protein [Perkinsela sp. CCAP 1560/4]|eukprot:KNH07482.1 chaperonin containing t-complex protein [Perkinsela sp. CCAP 1560/4]